MTFQKYVSKWLMDMTVSGSIFEILRLPHFVCFYEIQDLELNQDFKKYSYFDSKIVRNKLSTHR